MLLERVDSLIQDHSMTRAELERKLDFSSGSLRNWNKSAPSVDKIQKVADYFNVTTDYLLGREQQTENNETDLAKMLDGVMSFDGEPMTDHDKEVIMAFLEGKFGKK